MASTESLISLENAESAMRGSDGSNNEGPSNVGVVNTANDTFNFTLVAIKEEMDTYAFDNLLEDTENNLLETDGANHSNKDINDINQAYPWYEPIPSSNMCRCRLCNVRLDKYGFRRHILTQKHIMLVSQLSLIGDVKEEPGDVGDMWNIYKERHPWLTADPINPNCAFCTYCKKRLYHACSEIKRVLHENSEFHKRMVDEYNQKHELYTNNQNKRNTTSLNTSKAKIKRKENRSIVEEDNTNYDNEHDDDESMEDEEGEEGENDNSSSNETSESDTYSEKKNNHTIRGTKEWFDKYPWSKRYIKDSDFMFCTYCDQVMSILVPRHVHNNSVRHRAAEEELKKTISKFFYRKPGVNTAMKYYSWMIYNKNNPLKGQCKYCGVHMVRTCSRKHDLSQRHKDAFAAYQEKIKLKSTTKTQKDDQNYVNTPNKVIQNTLKHKLKKNVLLWQKRYPWLSLKKTQPNYVYCELCENTLYMPSLKYAMRHQHSPNHIRQHKKLIQDQIEGKSNNEKSVYKNKKKTPYIWYVPDKKNACFGTCKYCNVPVVSRIRHRHSMLREHRIARLLYDQRQSTPEKETSNAVDNADPPAGNSNAEISLPTTPIKDSYSNAVTTAKRLTDAHFELLQFTRKLQKDNAETMPKIIMAPSAVETDVLSNTKATASVSTSPSLPLPHSPQLPFNASIVPTTKLPQSPLNVSVVPTTPLPNIHDLSTDKKQYPLELFMSSIHETVKQLPADLIAEWKMKIMPILYDLEIRSLRRQRNPNAISPKTVESSSQTSNDGQFINSSVTRVENEKHSNKAAEIKNNKNNVNCHDKAITNRVAKPSQEIGKNLLKIIDSTTKTNTSNSDVHKNNSSMNMVPSLPPHIQVSKVPKMFKCPASNAALDTNGNNHAVGKSKVPISQSPTDGVRHIQINSQTSSKVIPLKSWTEMPSRRYSLNLTPQQMQHTIITTVRTSPQKFPSLNGSVNKQ